MTALAVAGCLDGDSSTENESDDGDDGDDSDDDLIRESSSIETVVEP